MKIPTITMAREILEEGGKLNPGPWINHSLNTATAAKLIAEYDNSIDPEVAYILGLLHDIGRRFGINRFKHTIDGYNFLNEKGFTDAAKICLTHTVDAKGNWDCTKEEYDFVVEFFNYLQFDEYDLLIQLCDVVSLPSGFCLLEKRLVDGTIRKGTADFNVIEMVEKWKGIFSLKTHFENKMGRSIYTLLPGVIENTFDISHEDIQNYIMHL